MPRETANRAVSSWVSEALDTTVRVGTSRPLPETAFLVEAAAHPEPLHWSDKVTDALAQLKRTDLDRADLMASAGGSRSGS